MKKILKLESVIMSISLTMALFLFYILNKYAIINKPCFILSNFGIYCPGCGGTRAVKELIHFNIINSLKYNPIVIYTGASFYIYSFLDIARVYKKFDFNKLMFVKNIMIHFGIVIVIFFIIAKNI